LNGKSFKASSWRGDAIDVLFVLLCRSFPLPWCVPGHGPRVDLEFCHTEVYVIPFTKGISGGEEFHRIPKLSCAHESCWHAVKRAIKHACDRSNDGLVLHEVSPLTWKVLSRFSDPLAYRHGNALA
jgi:hypothetical protein